MNHLDELNLLIDKASAIAGSDAKLARSIGVPPQHVSNWRHGHKTATPADQALMAHVAGLDPVQVLARATVAQYEGKAKGDALMKALGKASRLTGAVAGFVGAVALAIFSMTPQPGQAQTVASSNTMNVMLIYSRSSVRLPLLTSIFRNVFADFSRMRSRLNLPSTAF